MAPRFCFEDFEPGSTMSYGDVRVSKEDIVAFAARYDPQPFHLDPEAARKSFVGELIASGWHTCALQMRMVADAFILDASSMGSPGIDEVRWMLPVRPGDRLRARHTVLEARRSGSRPEMGLVRFRFETLNQNDEVVLEQTNWIMFALRERYREAGQGTRPPLGAAPHVAEADPPPVPLPFFEDLEIGSSDELGAYLFTAENIIDFASAFDPQLFHVDPDAAARSHFGALCASGWHTAAIWMKQMVGHRNRCRAEAERLGAPGAELGPSPGFRDLKWRKPVYVGDKIRYASRVVEKRELRSRAGWGLVHRHNTGMNQHGEIVLEFRSAVFHQRRPA